MGAPRGNKNAAGKHKAGMSRGAKGFLRLASGRDSYISRYGKKAGGKKFVAMSRAYKSKAKMGW